MNSMHQIVCNKFLGRILTASISLKKNDIFLIDLFFLDKKFGVLIFNFKPVFLSHAFFSHTNWPVKSC